MRILFLADVHPNLENWIEGLKKVDPKIEIEVWSMVNPTNVRFKKIIRAGHWVKALFTLKHTIKKINPDLVIGYRIPSYGFLAAYSKTTPVVLAAQGVSDIWPEAGISAEFKKLLYKYAVRRSNLVQSWGAEMKKNMLRNGCDESKILHLPRGIDLSVFNTEGRKKSVAGEKITFISSRGLHPDYNHHTILSVLQKCKSAGLDFHYYIAGDGILRDYLQREVEEMGLSENVDFLDRLNNQELAKYYRKSDIYISLPVSEGVSASLLEAIACGCYPIVSQLPSNEEWIINNTNGNLVPKDDIAGIAGLIISIAKDSELHDRAREFNRQLVNDKVDNTKNMKIFLARYRSICVG